MSETIRVVRTESSSVIEWPDNDPAGFDSLCWFKPHGLPSRRLPAQERNAVHLWWCRYGRQVSVDVGDFLVGHHLCCVRRHLVAGLPQFLHERSIRNGLRSQPRTIATLPQRVMTLEASL